MFIDNIYGYLHETIKLKEEHSSAINYLDIIRFLPKWYGSLSENRSPLIDKQPWFSFAAIEFLEKILNKDMVVYEYGSGGSTLFFSEHAKKVISVEHNKEWHEKMSIQISSSGIQNCEVGLFEASEAAPRKANSISNPDDYISEDLEYQGMEFKEYASNIDAFPDNYFDVIDIDGRARPSCFKHALKKIKNNGYLILDNAEREHYSYIHETLDNSAWEKNTFAGPFPYIRQFGLTCIWKKLHD